MAYENAEGSELYQNDSACVNKKVGSQNSLTIGQVGCLVTGLAMTVNHFGGRETVASFNDKMVANKGFNGAWIKSASVPAVFSHLGFKRQKHVECEGSPAPLELIDTGLEAGSLVIVRVDWSADPGIQGHWVVIHEKVGNDYAIWDPWKSAGASTKLVGRYGATAGSQNPADVILEAIWHGKGDLPAVDGARPKKPATHSSKTAPSAPKKPATPTTDAQSFGVKSNTILNLRKGNSTAMAVVGQLKPNTTADVLEDMALASAKVGQQGQWLHVRTNEGKEGYVAAWLVQKTAVSTKEQPPTPAKPASTLMVKTTTILNLRQGASTGTAVVIQLANGAKLTVLEDEKTAVGKIGKQNQWLHVRTSDGKEGYAAAWFVKKA